MAVVASVLVITVFSWGGLASQDVSVSFCGFPVNELVRYANIDFQIALSFETDSDGRPTDIKVTRNPYNEEARIVSCVREWKFANTESVAEWQAKFYWKHGVGWVRLQIEGPDVSYSIRTSGQHCHYGSDSTGSNYP